MKDLSSLLHRTVDSLQKNGLMVFCAAHLAVCLLIWLAGGPTSEISSESSGYIGPGREFLETGVYPPAARLPGYILFIAFGSKALGGIGVWIVVVQSVFLCMTAFLGGKLADEFHPGAGFATMLLCAFNPIALYYAQVVEPEIMFSLLFMGQLYLLVRAYEEVSLPLSLAAGVLVGLCTLTRSNGQFLVLAIPVILFVGRWIHARSPSPRMLLHAAAAMACALAVMSPWVVYQKKTMGSYHVTSPSYKDLVVYDNLQVLEMMATGTTGREADVALRARVLGLHGLDSATPLSEVSTSEMKAMIRGHIFDLMFFYPPAVLIKAALKAEAIFLCSAGASSWLYYFAPGDRTTVETLQDSGIGWMSIFKKMALQNGATLLIYCVTWGFVLPMRLLGLLGLGKAVAGRNWELVFICGINIVMFALMTAFAGFSRYRLPVEPLLLLLSVVGAQALMGGRASETTR